MPPIITDSPDSLARRVDPGRRDRARCDPPLCLSDRPAAPPTPRGRVSSHSDGHAPQRVRGGRSP